MICSRASALARSSSWSLYGCCQKASASSGVSLARLARSSLKRSMRSTSFDNAARLNAIDFVKLLHHSALFALCDPTLRRLRLDKCSKQRASSEHAQHIVGWLPIGSADHQWRRDAQCWKLVAGEHWQRPRREEAWRRAQPTAAKRESLPASRGAHVYRSTELYRYPDI